MHILKGLDVWVHCAQTTFMDTEQAARYSPNPKQNTFHRNMERWNYFPECFLHLILSKEDMLRDAI